MNDPLRRNPEHLHESSEVIITLWRCYTVLL